MLRKRVICTAQLWQLKTVVVQVRFIFPALLLFNIAAAAGLARLHQNRGKGRREQLAWWAALALLAASATASAGMAVVSWANYPGGHALRRLHAIVDAAPEACTLPSMHDLCSPWPA